MFCEEELITIVVAEQRPAALGQKLNSQDEPVGKI
jgi:hypothetical protein